MRNWRLVVFLLLVLLIQPAPAIIEIMLSMEEVIDKSSNILCGKIEKVDKEALVAVVAV
jgi:hypothetical protein